MKNINNKKQTNVTAIRCSTCNDTIYSRCLHDLNECFCKNISITGGTEFVKISYKTESPTVVTLKLNHSCDDLFEDWNKNYNKLGVIKYLTPDENTTF